MMLSLLLLTATLRSSSDTTPPGPWRAETAYAIDRHSGGRSTWRTIRASLGYRGHSATVIVDGLSAKRFDQWDRAVGVETYFSAGGRVSGYVRVQAAPSADVLPTSDVSGELTAGVARGWEVGGSFRRMDFTRGTVPLIGIAGARYAGPWYLQARGTVVPKDGILGLGLGLRARRSLDPNQPDQVFEITGAVGREVILPDPGREPEVRSTTSLGARLQRRLGAGWGVAPGAGWTKEAKAPGRVNLNLGLYLTW